MSFTQQDQNRYSTQERQASQAFSRGERSASQKYNTGERLSSQKYNTGERLSSQKYNTGEREASELFQAREASKARAQNFMANKMLEASSNKFSADKDYTGGATGLSLGKFNPSGKSKDKYSFSFKG